MKRTPFFPSLFLLKTNETLQEVRTEGILYPIKVIFGLAEK